MDELIPFLIFIIIAAVNLIKYIAEKGAKKQPTPKPESERSEREPSTLEQFFEEVAKKFEPKPRELPEWPEEVERPDYLKQMEEFETPRMTPSATPVASVSTPDPQPTPYPMMAMPVKVEPLQAKGPGATTTFKIPTQGTLLTGAIGQRISMPPLLRSAAGRTRFELDSKEQLKQSLLAHMVFGPPRAYDQSFHNTMAK